MYQKIKTLADEALAWQNKVRMEEALREISALCGACEVVEPQKVFAPGLSALADTPVEAEQRYSGPSHGPITKALMAETVKKAAKK